MIGDTERNIVKNLLRGTVNDKIDWHVKSDRWTSPLETYFDGYHIEVFSGGKVKVIYNRIEYPFKVGSMGEDLYRAARNRAWNREDYDDVIEDLDESLTKKFES